MSSQPKADAPLAQKNRDNIVAIATTRVKSILLTPTFYKVLCEVAARIFEN
jgi:hypothetical protein